MTTDISIDPLVGIDVPPGWECVELETLCDATRGIRYGVVQPGQADPTGISMIRVNNIKDGRISSADVLSIAPAIEEKYARTRLQGGEVLLSLVGTLGECAVVTEELRGSNVARAVAVIPVNDAVDARWVAICLRSKQVQHVIRTWATTTVQATLNLRDVRRLPILLPPVRVRERLLEVLGALDDKIELNRQMNAMLEATARAVFKSWFVDFDPVRAKLDGRRPHGMNAETAALFPDSFEHVDGELVPAGWEEKPLTEAFEVNPRLSLKKGDEAPYLEMRNVPTSGPASNCRCFT